MRTAESGVDASQIADYDDFKAAIRKSYSRTAAASTVSSRDVAHQIYKAATDGTKQLRYFIGNDSRGFLKAKQTLADQDYVDYMRMYFREPGDHASPALPQQTHGT